MSLDSTTRLEIVFVPLDFRARAPENSLEEGVEPRYPLRVRFFIVALSIRLKSPTPLAFDTIEKLIAKPAPSSVPVRRSLG